MSDYIVSARKYRPSTFKSVVGQNHVAQTLKNAITNNKVAQAYLFTGPRGVGKTTCARILAKGLNCTNIQSDGEPCNECESCRNFNEQRSLNIYELDAASNNSVDDIRALVDQVRFAPQSGNYKIYIIDEVHMLSQAAFNAFLKTLEEPPAYAIFILATTEKHKIIPTILSRCQIFDFNRIQIKDMVEHLTYIARQENVDAEEDGLHIIAQKADGALRDALSIFDRIISFTGNSLTYQNVIDNLNIIDYEYYFKMCDYAHKKDLANCLLLLNDIINLGFEGQNLIQGLSEHYRNLLVAKKPETLPLLEMPEAARSKYLKQSSSVDISLILSALNILSSFNISYKESKNPRLHTELCLMKLAHLNDALQFVSQPGAEKKKESAKLEEDDASTIQKEEASEVKEPQLPKSKIGNLASLREKVAKKVENNTNNGVAEHGSNQLEVTENKPNDVQEEASNFDYTKFLSAFHNFIEDVLKGNKKNLYSVLQKHEPELIKNNHVKLTFENAALETMFNEERSSLIDYLSKNHNIEGVYIETRVKPLSRGEKEKYIIHPVEKYKVMSEKYPELKNLQQKLNLQPEE